MVFPVSKFKEQFLLYEDFTSSTGGYTPVKNLKKLVKSLERLQSQYNLTPDKVTFSYSRWPHDVLDSLLAESSIVILPSSVWAHIAYQPCT